MYKNCFANKKILITGHTGFKGSWLSVWLLKLGADIIGISKDIPTNPSMFEVLNLEREINHNICDITNFNSTKDIIVRENPDLIIHLAAQPIVSTSFKDPINTITTNVIGTTNILEILREYPKKIGCVFITSDKAYDNVEQVWGYKENDKMGGKDIYSGSKGSAELIIKSYQSSFLMKRDNIKIAIGRAGNVIGGGDWAQDRIVVDCMKAWSMGNRVEIRSPNATRPWQHVLEPLSGYLSLAENICNDRLDGEGFNFGPNADQNASVKKLIKDLSQYWNFKNADDSYKVTSDDKFNECSLLKLNCDKALYYLKWSATLKYDETIKFTSQWYYEYFNKNTDLYTFTINQINDYENLAKERKLQWTE